MPKAKIKINELKIICKEKDLQCLVTIEVSRDGVVSIVTYGETKSKCKAIGDWASGLWSHCISLNPFQTAFGWGKGGCK